MNITDLRTAIYRVLEYAPQGLHIDAITMAIVNDSRTLFEVGECAELLRRRVAYILAYCHLLIYYERQSLFKHKKKTFFSNLAELQ